MPMHIEDLAFQYWQVVYRSYVKNAIIDDKSEDKMDEKEVTLTAFNGTCDHCGQWGHKEANCYAKKHINSQVLATREGGNQERVTTRTTTITTTTKPLVITTTIINFKRPVIIVENLVIREWIVTRRQEISKMENQTTRLQYQPFQMEWNSC